MFISRTSEAVEQIFRWICKLMHIWEPEELGLSSKNIESASKQNRKLKVLSLSRRVTRYFEYYLWTVYV